MIFVVGRQKFARIVSGLAALLVTLTAALACDYSAPAPAATNGADRIFIVHSYSAEFSWTRDLHQGIIHGLAEGGLDPDRDYQSQTFFMDTRINFTSPRQIEERATDAIAALQEFAPDVLFVTDDIALEHVAVRYTEENPEDRLPVVFAGINVDPTIYAPIDSLEAPGGSITGVLERIPHSEAFATARRLFPDANRVVILADAGAGSQSVHDELARDLQSDTETFEVLDFLLLETFDQWQRAVVEYQDSADLIAVLNFHQLHDASGAVVPPIEVIDWMVTENNLPELGLVADWARDGILVAVGNSGFKTGAYVGALGTDILNGADPAKIPIVDPKMTDANLNLARARSLGIEFPADEVAAADLVFETIGGR
ncbi:MAG: ABC transporter substrate binding protein [Rhodospirillales bacterium]|nr:ABC transporter substrate binding protein [Rhodospirillales bacterium]